MSVAYNPQTVTDGLVLYLDAANTKSYPGTGTSWTDLSVNRIVGTLTSGPTFSSLNKGCFVFDGIDDYVNLGSSNAITGNNLTTITLEVWVKYSSTGPGRLIAIQRGSGGLNSSLAAMQVNVNQGVTTAGYLQFVTRNSTNSNVEYLNLNGNYHLVGTFQNFVATITGTSRALYVNGDLVASDTVTGLPSLTNNTDPALVGIQPGLTSPFDGTIAIVKVYNRALSQNEVRQNFNALRGRFGV